ncbi:MAG: ribonuclease P protein component [Myxococcales bacterium]|nr:ribonuclease P protein component [Myxococcales bacterium]
MTLRRGPEPSAGGVDGDVAVARDNDERLPKSHRLRKRREFLAVQNRGRKHHAKHLLVFTRALDAEGDTRDATPSDVTATAVARRVGFTVSSKVGNAVVRNRVKRRLRDVWRRHCGVMPSGLDYVLVAKRTAAEATYDALVQDFRDVARRVKR